MRFSWSSLKIKGLYLDEEEEIAFLFAQIILSMHHIHSNSILHRDLKAQNIFLTRSRNFVKVHMNKILDNLKNMDGTTQNLILLKQKSV